MGGCFSSSAAREDAAAGYGGGEKRAMRVWPSDYDGGRWPYYVGERDVDTKARIFIDNFHRHRSGEVCEDCPDQKPPQTPAAAAAAGAS
ncbi:unnamed protein product [Urochloa decumbens]|uniref:Uncharacterized protein n=1 Tax=Urochloa decumbens TaxID=240449 RepID=A0ABC9ELU7_9POAL